MGVKEFVKELWAEKRNRKKLEQLKDAKEKVRKALEGIKDVSSFELNPKQKKVSVTGYIEQDKLIKRLAHKTGKKVEPWPYVPYEVVPHPYAPGAYDKKAPPGYVKNVLDDPDAAPFARANSLEEKYSSALSDENPNHYNKKDY
ncbi:Heavy metal-associated isoprenylated plant protein 26 [Rhynchospora pubera]|uniref:Heavy metal-associated isoprenylated plant protein 26 n=1 Tax=Rhynchospora pubera TaxID=906938 RepID=A0AAV8GCM6_9POAL|nr:Heavy metal-associated isoprenylated plant protein 26 [Rhynchospora pubera]